MIRLYGSNAGSFRTVSEGMKLALEKQGRLAGYSAVSSLDWDECIPGADAYCSLTVGPPMNILTAHVKGLHQKHALMLAPNSEGIPPQLREDLSASTYSEVSKSRIPIVDTFLAPSKWAQDVLRREFPEHEVLLCQHGVLPEFKLDKARREIAEQSYREGNFQVLHFTSSKFSRKGTAELAKMWGEFVDEFSDRLKSARLDIFCNPAFLIEMKHLNSDNVFVHPAQNFTYDQLVKGMSAYHLIAQPSRSEGFGLIPLEARACGIPAMYSRSTGHLDHFPISPHTRGCLEIEVGGLADSDDYWGAKAPALKEQGIYQGLVDAYVGWEELNILAGNQASFVQKSWAWELITESATRELLKAAPKEDHHGK